MKNNRGFTLVELMITIAILATLTIFTAQAISQAIKAKGKIQDQIDEVSRMRDAIRLLEKDINLAYHERDLEKEIEKLIKKPKAAAGAVTPPIPGVDPRTTAPEAPPDPRAQTETNRQDPSTNFMGTNDSINFVTKNNGRNVRDTQQADFAEVGYTLKDCRSLKKEGGSSKCLWRRSTPAVDLDVTKGGDEVVLLENVTEFKLRYIGKGKQDWSNDWSSDFLSADATMKGKFPQAVEISITVEKPSKLKAKKYSMQVIAPIHFPNNPEE